MRRFDLLPTDLGHALVVVCDLTQIPYMSLVCFQRSQALAAQELALHYPAQLPARHKRFQCSVCIRDFASIDGLRLHEDLHKGRYRYHCGKGFSGTTNLKGHMAKQTGVSEYKCQHCDREFSYSASLKNPMKSCHK